MFKTIPCSNCTRALRWLCGILPILAIALVLSWSMPTITWGQDADVLAKRIQRELSAAKFSASGDPKKAKEKLLRAGEMLEELRATAPNFPKLEKLDKSYDDVAQKIMQKMLQTITMAVKRKRSRIESSLKRKDTDRARQQRDELAEILYENEEMLNEAGDPGAKLKAETEAYLAKVNAEIGDEGKTASSAESDEIAKRLGRDLSGIEMRAGSDPTRAAQDLEKAREQFEVLQAQAPNHSKIDSLRGKLDKLATKLGQSAPQPTPAQTATATPSTTKPAKTSASGEKLPGGATYKLDQIAKNLDRAEQAVAKGGKIAESANRQLESAAKTLAQIRKDYADRVAADHPRLLAADERLAAISAAREVALKEEASAEEREQQAAAQREVESGAWLGRLEPFLDSASPTYVRPSKTTNPSELKRSKKAFDQASVVFVEYREVAFPAGKTRQLQGAEEKLAGVLKAYPETYRQSVDDLAQYAEDELDRQAARLEAWAKDPEKSHLLLGDQLEKAQRGVDAVAEAAADDPRNAELAQKLAALVQANDARRQTRIQNTFMIPDRFQEDGIDEIKAKASQLVRRDFSDVKVLRVTVVSTKWREEEVEEWTDTTQTQLRRRITRSVTAEAAGKRSDEVYLYTVYVAKDRRSDGTWSALYGNLHDYPERMLEENVDREAP